MSSVEARSYFLQFFGKGFLPDSSASFEDEFKRLAERCRWEPEDDVYSKQLALAELARVENAANKIDGSLKFFALWHGISKEDSEERHEWGFGFMVEYKELAADKGWKPDSEKYRENLKEAIAVNTVPRPSVKFFEDFAATDGFVPNLALSVSDDFERLEVHMSWPTASQTSESQWRQVTSEATKLSEKPTTIQTDASLPNMEELSITDDNPLNTVSATDNAPSKNIKARDEIVPVLGSSSYFAQFRDSGFEPDPALTLEEEFCRLTLHKEWTDPAKLKQEYQRAVETELVLQYGQPDQLASWQKLCIELGTDPPPKEISDCKEALVATNVCITHFVHRVSERRKQRTVKKSDHSVESQERDSRAQTLWELKYLPPTVIYELVKDLSAHVLSHECEPFPKEEAQEDWFLKTLLRHVRNPSKDDDLSLEEKKFRARRWKGRRGGRFGGRGGRGGLRGKAIA